jgi:hypothetical protein
MIVAPSPPPATGAISSAASPPTPSVGPSTTQSPGPVARSSPRLGPRPRFEPGEYVWTVSDSVRVRSKPEVSTESVKYDPLLPTGTELFLIDGPVAGSGYWWYKVRLETVELRGRISAGWLAAGDHDGTAWIGYLDGLDGPDTEPVPDLPPLTDPALLLTDTEDYISSDGGAYTRYSMTIANWRDYAPELFEPAPDLEPCGLNANASRTWVNIIDAERDAYLYGFCGLGHPQDLTSIWFAVPTDTTPPSMVYVLLYDRLTERIAESNVVHPVPPS